MAAGPPSRSQSPDLHDYHKCDRSTLGCQDPGTLVRPPPPQSEKVVIVLKDIDYRRTRADTCLVACYDLWSGKGMGLFLTYPRDTLRTGPFLFQTRGRNRRPNVALVFCCSFCVVASGARFTNMEPCSIQMCSWGPGPYFLPLPPSDLMIP